MINAVGDDDKLWAGSQYTRKRVTKNGKTTYTYTNPWVVTAHDFRLDIPKNAYVKRVAIQLKIKCSKGLDVLAPMGAFMLYHGKGNVSPQKVNGKTGWYNKTYRVYPTKKVSSTAQIFSYVLPEEEWLKIKYPPEQLMDTVMGMDFHFQDPISMNGDVKNIFIDWVRIKVDYELPDTYVKFGNAFVDETNPYLVDMGSVFSVPIEFGNRSKAKGDDVSIPVTLPKGTELVGLDYDSNSTFTPIDAFNGEYLWKCKCLPKIKVPLTLHLKAQTLGYKNTVAYLDNVAYTGYAYSRGVSGDFGAVRIESGDVQKGQISCFDFYCHVNSVDSSITYDVVVDGLGQSNPSDLSEAFRLEYHNRNGTGNNLVAWNLVDTYGADVSIDTDLTTNNQITFNIPEDTDVNIHFRGCFIPVTVGDNELYLTNRDTGQKYTYEYTSLAPKTTNLIIEEDTTHWYDHWITTRMETGAFILPFATKDTDRTMIEGQGSLTMTLEKPQAYIGCIPLPTSHYEPSSDFSNKVIKEQYKNKLYMGKSGEIDESISFKIKLPPADWTTLQGLCELDKPVPVNAVPTAFEGDVINHRGWVELGGVKNVEKTNPLYYDGELELEYLTHNINTRFQIIRGVKSSNYTPSVLTSLLDYSLESGDEFVDYIHINDDGDIVHNDTGYFNLDTDGVYIYDDEMPLTQRTLVSLDNNQSVIIKSVKPLKENTEINFEWSSTKIQEDRENNIQRIVRIVNKEGAVILEYEYYDYQFDYDDELYSCSVKCTKLNKSHDGQDTVIETDDLNFAVDLEALSLTVDEFGNLVQEVEPETGDGEETEPTYIDPVTGEVVEIVQEAEIYADYMFGSKLTFELANNILNINDSGFNGREVHVEDVELEKDEYYLEVEFRNRNIDSDTDDVLHFFDFEILEPFLVSDFTDVYSDLVVSSHSIPDKTFAFLRDSEEGTLYYYKNDGKPFTYIQEPFYMYARGVDLKANNNISIFNLNNSYTTFYVQNGLVRAGFNRLNGRVYIAKFDLISREYVDVAILQLNKLTVFKTGAFSDDKIEVIAGKTVFTVYRGHPYIVVKHSNDDIQFITRWNKVYADGINDVLDSFPVLWDLQNNENMLPSCVGGLDLKASCLSVEQYDNQDVGTFANLVLTQITSNPVYIGKEIVFGITGSVTNVDEDIPIEIDFNGAFGEYSSEIVVDERLAAHIDVSADASVIQSGDTNVLRSKVTDYGFNGVNGIPVYFYKLLDTDASLNLTGDKSIVQSGDPMTFTATLIDEEISNRNIYLYEKLPSSYKYYNDGTDLNTLTIPSTASVTVEDGALKITTSTTGEKTISYDYDLNNSDNFIFECEVAKLGTSQSVAMFVKNATTATGCWFAYENDTGKFGGAITGSSFSNVDTGTLQVGDKIKIKQENGVITLYHNDNQIYSKTVDLGTNYRIGHYTNKDRIQYIKNISLRFIGGEE